MAVIMNAETIGKFKKSWFLNGKVPTEDDLEYHYDDEEEREYGGVYVDCYGNIVRTYSDSISGLILLGCKDLDFAICMLTLEKDGTLTCNTEYIDILKYCEDDDGWRCDGNLIVDETGNITEAFLEFAGLRKDNKYGGSLNYFCVPYTDIDSGSFREGKVVLTKEAEKKWKKILAGEIPAHQKTENQAKLYAGTLTDYFVIINEDGENREVALYSDDEGLFIKGDALESLKGCKERKFYIYVDASGKFAKDFSQIKPSPATWLRGKPQGFITSYGDCDIVSKRKKGEPPIENFDDDPDILDKFLQKKNLKFKKIEETKDIFKILGIFNQKAVLSNMLAWLLRYQDWESGHGFQGTFLKLILAECNVPFAKAEQSKNDPNLWNSFGVYREVPIEDEDGKGSIDILCISEKQKFVLCIENNTGAGEYSNQLARYADFIEKKFCAAQGFEALFVYLTPHGDIPSDARWKALDYLLISYGIDNEDNLDLAAELRGFISNYDKILSEIRRCKIAPLFRNFLDFGMREKLKKDFPSLEARARSWSNILFSDSSLKEFARGKNAEGADLFFIAIKLEAYELAHGVLSCVLTFTNHPANLAEGSAFRKKFNPKHLQFNWFDAIRIEERVLNDGESFDDFSKDEKCSERFYAVIKTLLARMKEEMKARGL